MRLLSSLVISSSLTLVACGGDDEVPRQAPTVMPAPSASPSPVCTRGAMERDFTALSPLGGPGVDPATGALRPPTNGAYVVSSTYLTLRPEPAAQQAFGELMGPISETLATQPGLIAIQLGTSMACGTARTLTVWDTEESMYAFVASPPHAAAMARVGEVSRGQSVVTHWDASTVAEASWAEVERKLSVFSGIEY